MYVTMLRNFFKKWFNKNNNDINQQKVPQGFKQKNRRIFLNRYAGVIYFLLAWHTFGYLIIKFANISAHKRGEYQNFCIIIIK